MLLLLPAVPFRRPLRALSLHGAPRCVLYSLPLKPRAAVAPTCRSRRVQHGVRRRHAQLGQYRGSTPAGAGPAETTSKQLCGMAHPVAARSQAAGQTPPHPRKRGTEPRVGPESDRAQPGECRLRPCGPAPHPKHVSSAARQRLLAAGPAPLQTTMLHESKVQPSWKGCVWSMRGSVPGPSHAPGPGPSNGMPPPALVLVWGAHFGCLCVPIRAHHETGARLTLQERLPATARLDS